MHCYPRILTDDRRYSEVRKFFSFKISSNITTHLTVEFVSLESHLVLIIINKILKKYFHYGQRTVSVVVCAGKLYWKMHTE